MAVSTTTRQPGQREGLKRIQDGVRIAGARGPSVGGERRRYLGTNDSVKGDSQEEVWIKGRGGRRESCDDAADDRKKNCRPPDDYAALCLSHSLMAVGDLQTAVLSVQRRSFWIIQEPPAEYPETTSSTGV